MAKPFVLRTPPDPTEYRCVTCNSPRFRLMSNGDCICSVCGEISKTARCYAGEKPFGDAA